MATIEFSSGFMSGLPQRIIRLGAYSPNTGDPNKSGLLSCPPDFGYSAFDMTFLFLMKNDKPADFSTLTTYSARSSDVLATFQTGGVMDALDFSLSQTNVNPAIITTKYKAATQAGTATWFWWAVLNTPTNVAYPTASATPTHQIMGTVGTLGSGSDLEIVDTNVTVGQPVRVINLRIRFPSTFTY